MEQRTDATPVAIDGSGLPNASESAATVQAAHANEHKPYSAGDAAGADAPNLELVMDVDLNVTLRFGQRQLTLREVLDLSSGSVIELDRQVEEPIELLLDGKVIARGEAVVIDGNYGLRVSELPRSLSTATAGILKEVSS